MAPLERSERRILKKIKGAGDLEAEVEIKVVKKVDNPFTSSPKWRRDVGPDYLDLCSDS